MNCFSKDDGLSTKIDYQLQVTDLLDNFIVSISTTIICVISYGTFCYYNTLQYVYSSSDMKCYGFRSDIKHFPLNSTTEMPRSNM